MNLTLTKEQLLAGLQAVQNVVSTRTTLPILSNVLIRADGERVEFTATDLDVTVISRVECKARKAGATTLPVKKIVGIARELAGLEIELEVDDKNVCAIQSGPSFFKVRGLAAEEFPPTPTPKDDRKVTLSQEKVRTMLRKTSFAASSDEARYVLNGILFSLKEHKLCLVATDGRRLALVEEEVEASVKSQGDAIVPSKAVGELLRVLQDKGEVDISFTENQAFFNLRDEKGPTVTVITKLIEGNYPNYRQVIPAETKERVVLPREEFLHALRRAEIMTSDKQNSVKLTFSKNSLAITANTPEVGEARENMAVNYKGRDLAIAFNPLYVIEPLNVLTEDEITLELIDELSPGVIKAASPFLYVVMPMRLS